MKKRLAMALALVLALTLAAGGVAETAESAATWEDGLSAGKPYAGAPEVDLEAQLGYMIFYPNEKMQVNHLCRRLYIYLPRTDAEAGEGRLFVCTEADGEVWSTPMNDERFVLRRAMASEELDSLMWGDGTCFEISLPRSLELGKQYFVNIERGAITTSYEGVVNASIGGTEAWTFSIQGDYGVGGLEYRHAQPEGTEAETQPEPLTDPKAGDEIRFDLVLGGDAATAVIYGYYDTVEFIPSQFNESCEVIGQVTGDYPAWGIMFLDAEGNELNHLDF